MIIFLFSLIQIAHAGIVKHDAISSRLHEYSYQEFCDSMKAKNSMLISAKGLNEIECFNENFKISDFCLKKLPLDSNYTRGFSVESEKRVYCEEAAGVMLSVDCESKINFCKNDKYNCEKLKKSYASSLELSHSSVVDKKLNCYFSKKIEDDINEL
jgi:hypothetical protein